METLKFGACLGSFGACADRFCRSGYGPERTLSEMLEMASQVKDLKGIELVSNWHLNEENFEVVKKTLEKYQLDVCMMVPVFGSLFPPCL